jgi:hypothetical protein
MCIYININYFKISQYHVGLSTSSYGYVTDPHFSRIKKGPLYGGANFPPGPKALDNLQVKFITDYKVSRYQGTTTFLVCPAQGCGKLIHSEEMEL